MRILRYKTTGTLAAMVFVPLLGILSTGCGSSSAPKASTEQGPAATPAAAVGGTNSKLSSFAQEIQSSTTKLALRVGEKATIPVTVRNTGADTWTSIGTAPVVFSHRWFLGADDKVVETPRTVLQQPLPPGGSVSFDAPITAPATPGNYTLRLSMVQEGIAWFFREGGQSFDIPVTVR